MSGAMKHTAQPWRDKRTGRWWLRRRVPDIYRPVAGKQVVKIALKLNGRPVYQREAAQQVWGDALNEWQRQVHGWQAALGEAALSPQERADRALIASLAAQKGEYDPINQTEILARFFEIPEATITAMKPAVTPVVPTVSLTGLAEAWALVNSGLTPGRIREVKSAVRALSDFLDHDDASRVTKTDMVAYRDARLKGPPRYKTALQPTGCATHMKKIGGVLALAAADGRLTVNPMAGVRVNVPSNGDDEDKGPTFTDQEAAAVLIAARAETIPARRWAPFLAAYTGARIDNLLSLRKEDFSTVDGIPCVRLSASEAGNKRFVRVVPLHHALVAEGLLDYVSNLPAGGRLFNVAANSYGNRLAEWLHKHVTGEGAFHRFRHRHVDALRAAGAVKSDRDWLIGHKPDGVDRDYGRSGESVARLAALLTRVPVIT
jgi:integrase